MGVVTGEVLVDGLPRDDSFQRKTGYVQQQDVHLPTSTVREALQFSALLRQPAHFTRQERLDYVEEVLVLLGMQSYADAVVGVPGVGEYIPISYDSYWNLQVYALIEGLANDLNRSQR
jgi:ABC-type multidrug transport system ATPase subunit